MIVVVKIVVVSSRSVRVVLTYVVVSCGVIDFTISYIYTIKQNEYIHTRILFIIIIYNI
jgi:hypothetical protein